MVSRWFIALAPALLWAQAPPLTVTGKLGLHAERIYSPTGFLRSGISSGIAQWRDRPEEWGQGAEGYARRYGSRIAQRIVRNSMQFGIDSALRQDPRYFHSPVPGLRPRLKHALVNTILTRKDAGGRTLSTWRIGSAYGAAFVENAWFPPSRSGTRDALSRGTVTLGFDAAANILKEFWPDIKKRIRRR